MHTNDNPNSPPEYERWLADSIRDGNVKVNQFGVAPIKKLEIEAVALELEMWQVAADDANLPIDVWAGCHG